MKCLMNFPHYRVLTMGGGLQRTLAENHVLGLPIGSQVCDSLATEVRGNALPLGQHKICHKSGKAYDVGCREICPMSVQM